MTTFTDTFDRSDSSSLGPDWVEVSGDWSLISGLLSPGNAGGTIILRYATAMAGPDHFVQATIAATTAASHGIWGRGSSNISSGYLLRNDGSEWTLFSVVGGSFNVIGSYAVPAAPSDVVKLEMIGSAIKGYINGVARISVTDSSVTTGANVGFRSESSGSIRFDTFSAGDVSAGATLGTAAATETAQPLTGAKAATLTTATEADGAQALTGSKTATVGSADSSESAQPLTGAKTATLGTAAATEIAQPLTGSKTATLTPAAETSTAQALTGSKTHTLTPAAERDTAQGLGTPTDPDVEVDFTIGQPYAREATGQPYTTWETGQPW